MKARELETGMTVRAGNRVGVVTGIKQRVWFQVDSGKGPPRQYFVDGETEVEVIEL
jgi:hypothetical protein